MVRQFKRYSRVGTNLTPGPNFTRGNPRGVILAQPAGTDINVGFSLCHADDQFDREKANMIAMARLKNKPITLDIGNVSELLQNGDESALDSFCVDYGVPFRLRDTFIRTLSDVVRINFGQKDIRRELLNPTHRNRPARVVNGASAS